MIVVSEPSAKATHQVRTGRHTHGHVTAAQRRAMVLTITRRHGEIVFTSARSIVQDQSRSPSDRQILLRDGSRAGPEPTYDDVIVARRALRHLGQIVKVCYFCSFDPPAASFEWCA